MRRVRLRVSDLVPEHEEMTAEDRLSDRSCVVIGDAPHVKSEVVTRRAARPRDADGADARETVRGRRAREARGRESQTKRR